MATTKKKKPPKCTKGQPCGLSCISWFNKDGSKRKCSDPVDSETLKEVAPVLPQVAGKKTKKKTKARLISLQELKKQVYEKEGKSVTGALSEIDPLSVKLSMADNGKYDRYTEYFPPERIKDMEEFAKTLEKKGVDPETAKVYAFATQLWFSGAYSELTPGTYKPSKELKPGDDDISLLTGVVATLKLLPPVSMEDKDLQDDIDYNSWDKKTVNRFMNVPNAEEFATKYKPGSTITEDGLFGTTMRDPNKFEHEFSGGSNIRFTVKAKLDGTGQGKFTDGLKTTDYKEQGQILYGPGATFKVNKVTSLKRPSLGLGLYDPDEYDEDQKPVPPDKVSATLKYLDDHEDTLKAQFGDNYKDRMFEVRDPKTGGATKIKASEVSKYQKNGQDVHLVFNLDRDYEQTIIELEEVTKEERKRV